MENLIKMYEGLLESLNMTIDAQGLVSYQAEDGVTPVTVPGGLRLAVPRPALLRSGQWEGLQPFHPLSEHIFRGESPVLKLLRTSISIRLTAVITNLLGQLVELGADTSRHKRLSPKASELLTHLKEADEKSVGALERVLEEVTATGENKVISLYLKRGGHLKGEKYQRVAVVSFPMLQQFDSTDSRTVFGVTLRKKDYVAFKQLFLYLLPGADDIETYSAGSQSNYAPYFDSLVHAYGHVALRLNEVVTTFKKYLENPDDMITDLGWLFLAEDLDQYRDLIKPLSGNEGELLEKDNVTPAKPAPATRAVVKTQPAPAAPVAVEEKSTEPTSIFNTNLTAKDLAKPQLHSAFEETPNYAVHRAVNMPGHAADAAGVVHTKEGVDLRTLLAAREKAMSGGFVTPMHAAVPAGTYARNQPYTQAWAANPNATAWGTPTVDPSLPAWAQGGPFGANPPPVANANGQWGAPAATGFNPGAWNANGARW